MPQFLRLNDCLIHLRYRPGTGRALVFANSLGTDLRLWDAVIAALPTDCPVLGFDKPGHGLSQGTADSIHGMADDLAALMDHLGVRDALICGISVGGMIAQSLAARRGDLVAGLALVATGHRIGTAQMWSDRLAALAAGGIEPLADAILQRWFAPDFHHRQPDLVAGYRMMLTRTPLDGYSAVCAAIRDADLTDSTATLRCPTLCIAGAHDLSTPPDLVRAMADLIPGARFLCYDTCGHLPCIEAPDRLAGDILSLYRALP